MSNIYEDLYQFSSYVPPIDLTFHQYMLLTDEPILVHTGDINMAKVLIPQLKDVLKGRTLKYIFVSHFESDECGGLSLMLEQFPEASIICSEITARQLGGFGITKNVIIKKSGEKLISGSYELEFINYPSEMHLWDGLLLIENKRGIFFSSDLMFRPGKAIDSVIEGSWKAEVGDIDNEKVPDPEKREKLKKTLEKFNPKFAAVGHGHCLRF